DLDAREVLAVEPQPARDRADARLTGGPLRKVCRREAEEFQIAIRVVDPRARGRERFVVNRCAMASDTLPPRDRQLDIAAVAEEAGLRFERELEDDAQCIAWHEHVEA